MTQMPKEDEGFFIGLVSLSYRTNYDSIKKYLKLLFSSYKENLVSVSHSKKFSNNLYNPTFYHIFGHYDLAVISFVDDFLFGQQKFKPFSETALCDERKFKKVEFRNFSYQVHNCVVSHKHIFHPALIPNPPLILFSHFKIKSSLIIGVGEDAIKFAIQKAIKTLGKRSEFFVLRTNSWHELIMVFFGDNPKEMTNEFLHVRELITSVQDIGFSGTFVNDLYSGNEHEPFPLFSFVHSYFGINYDISESERISFAESLKLYTNLFVRPGYLNQLSKKLNSSVTFGSGDLVIHNTNFELLHATSDENNKGNGISLIKKTKSTPQVEISKKLYANIGQIYSSKCSPRHATDILVSSIGLSQKDVIKQINNTLCQIKIDKAIRSRILKAIINYKDAIQDSALYSYFIDLSPFVHTIVNYVNKFSEDYARNTLKLPLQLIHKRFNELADVVEVAYRTRVQHSHRTLDMTDSTLEFSGGVHQIISAYDNIFKLFRKVLGYYRDKYEEDYTAVASLSSLPGISSDKYSININYLYLSQPEFFLATIFKESLNGMLDIRMGTLEMFPGNEITINDVVAYLKGEYKLRSGENNSNLPPEDIEEQCHFQFLMLLTINEIQVISKTKKAIINSIQKLDISVHRRWEMWEFTLLINKNLIEYLTYDFYNYTYFFDENYESYLFWKWHLFFQERSHYEIDGLLKIDNFLRLLFRTRFLINSIENNANQNAAYDYLEELINSYEPSKVLYSIKGPDFNYFFDFLFKRNDSAEWDKEAVGCRVVNGVFHLSFIRSFNKCQTRRGIKFLSYFMFNKTSGSVGDHFESLKKTIQDYLDDIRVKYAPRVLNISRSEFPGNMIYRDYHTGKVMVNKDGTIRIRDGLYFDSGGGLFVVGSARAVYFTKRNALMKKLISWSNKFKYEIYTHTLKYEKISADEK